MFEEEEKGETFQRISQCHVWNTRFRYLKIMILMTVSVSFEKADADVILFVASHIHNNVTNIEFSNIIFLFCRTPTIWWRTNIKMKQSCCLFYSLEKKSSKPKIIFLIGFNLIFILLIPMITEFIHSFVWTWLFSTKQTTCWERNRKKLIFWMNPSVSHDLMEINLLKIVPKKINRNGWKKITCKKKRERFITIVRICTYYWSTQKVRITIDD